MLESVRESDPILYSIVNKEFNRQQTGLEMIASESYVPPEILELQGSIMTNKTTEGFPGKRYHGGCEFVDEMETLGIERAKALYKAGYANIQPHSGSQANQTVYAAILQPGDKVLGLRLDQGGHLTHGNQVNFSGKFYDFASYGLDKETELIDYDFLEELANVQKPKLIVTGGSAYPRQIDYERIGRIAKSVGAYYMVDMAHVAGLVAAGHYDNPMLHADFVTSTTTKTLCGARGGFILAKEEFGKLIDKALFPGSQGSPHLHTMAAKAFTFRRAETKEFQDLMDQVIRNAKALGRELSKKGFRMVSGGTDSHLLLVDLREKNITGKELEVALDKVGITVNKNMIPFDPEKPLVTSGVRIGTTALTIKGFKENDMIQISDLINRVSIYRDDQSTLEKIREEVLEISGRFPLYSGYFQK